MFCMRKAPMALFGSRRDQKKVVRSKVVPHNVPGLCAAISFPMQEIYGSVKVGRGQGEKVFAARRSAMKAAFSEDLGRRNTDILSCVGPL